ncbi:outer membrane protein assembly factor BamA [Psychromonas sp. 14N.309.X.WAT.B.A12]|uniref:outer membrane protein assembly factor BamA n=1 Tax=unclassified Psychromonas TaxID=2614957 RepID=UPI0025B1CC9C|nr:outer membrane protein assembly factor BamA [Psychromonas sp. 14N.309.X.WAT.B.A12]MDN2662900.1 outer membrane protein assembly factor BamA [Psychromonas sp. 14N.309.X.WAT.B.A12]
MFKKYLLAMALTVTGCFSNFVTAEEFTISDLQFKGLQRVTLGAALLSLPIREGDVVDDYDLSQAIKKLYSTSYFESIQLFRDDSVLVFKVKERPTISAIELTGNDKLSEEQILDSLKSSSIQVGDTLDRTVLTSIEKSLEDFYHSVGKYSAQVETIVTPLPRNRVSLQFVFREGLTAKIEQINIVGNSVYSDEQLLKRLTLSESNGWWDLFADDNYQKQKLSGDLEVIKSYYLDRGYIRFKIDETQVALRPNKKGVYVTVNVKEGDIYNVSDVTFIGDLLGHDEDIKSLVSFKKGDVYAASEVAAVEQSIRKYFGRLGYAFPEINTYPEIDDETNTVVVNFSVDPGQRGYVRYINISGNTTTKDVVLRREMRQMEGGWLSSENIELSRARLNRLGFFSKVDIDTERVSDDLVDVNVNVEEQSSGSFNAGIGFGTDSGVSLSGGIQESNFLGSGDKISLQTKVNDYSLSADLSYTTPYLTKDGVSGGAQIYYNKFEAGDANIVDYTNTTYGLKLSAGFPVNEINRLGFSIGWENNGISQLNGYEQLSDFWDIYGSFQKSDGSANFKNFDASATWTRNNLDRGQLATQGMSHTLKGEMTIPGSDLQYFKINFDIRNYQRLTLDGSWTTLLRGSLGYGNGYGTFEGSDQILPFFENYYVGGYRTIRGFSSNSVGPRAFYTGVNNSGNTTNTYTDSAVGGNAKYTLSAELIFPTPFLDEAYSRQLRSSVFIDAGEVWDTEFDYDTYSSYSCSSNCDYAGDYSKPGRTRVSMGTQLTWVSPLGPLVFTLAVPLKDYAGDTTEIFSFNIGDVF